MLLGVSLGKSCVLAGDLSLSPILPAGCVSQAWQGGRYMLRLQMHGSRGQAFLAQVQAPMWIERGNQVAWECV